MSDLNACLELVRIARLGAEVVLRHYAGAIGVEYKAADDPVTAVDLEVNALVCAELARSFPGVPIVAEENDPSTFDVRRDAAECFFVDPLDGTRELVARNGEFAVMIGLARRGRATLGVVAAPVTGRVHYGARGEGAFELHGDHTRAIHPSEVALPTAARVLVSRSHTTPETLAALAKLKVPQTLPLGSAGLKAVAVACGEADMWLQVAGSAKLWDACGPEAVAVAAGAVFGDGHGRSIDYAAGPLALDGVLVASTRALFDAVVQSS